MEIDTLKLADQIKVDFQDDDLLVRNLKSQGVHSTFAWLFLNGYEIVKWENLMNLKEAIKNTESYQASFDDNDETIAMIPVAEFEALHKAAQDMQKLVEARTSVHFMDKADEITEKYEEK